MTLRDTWLQKNKPQDLRQHTGASTSKKKNPEEGTKHNFITLQLYRELKWFNRGELVQNAGTVERCAGRDKLRDENVQS